MREKRLEIEEWEKEKQREMEKEKVEQGKIKLEMEERDRGKQREIADLFTKGSHHKNISIVHLTQNIFPKGKAFMDITLRTQYLVLFNNSIDRQQVAPLASSTSTMFIKLFKEATSQPYAYLI